MNSILVERGSKIHDDRLHLVRSRSNRVRAGRRHPRSGILKPFKMKLNRIKFERSVGAGVYRYRDGFRFSALYERRGLVGLMRPEDDGQPFDQRRCGDRGPVKAVR
ncbi:hypothetical protein [Burkholderia sp. Ac-20344]|uniref:hypothetical protein n=1 Tax=Burkholderia sp. Ac-20344 TaxID=2703890 RepID=UPI00197BDB68|nr:hypothetical protein [Burkholderia sp. Ac-20344]MBN3834663.1 hypothetical protein [Burkholderia sp. Ac-20344]